ncbi:MAG: hypothetical protein CSA62_02375 [Planctomycetota bacterium]|nr:MAG: hypothetical protein CSA62_02375 [Planctomycetota bacterium]
MKLFVLMALGLFGLLPRGQEQQPVPAPIRRRPARIFEIVERAGILMHLRAVRVDVSAWNALRALEKLGAFRLVVPPELRGRLQTTSLTLSFESMEAFSIAKLACVAAGLDMVNDSQQLTRQQEDLLRRLDPDAVAAPGGVDAEPRKTVVLVLDPPDAQSQSGRSRLRTLALDWYGALTIGSTGLPDYYGGEKPLRGEPDPFDEDPKTPGQVLRSEAELRKFLGDYQGAARGFEEFYRNVALNDPAADYVGWAKLEEARCYCELGQYDLARQRSRDVMNGYSQQVEGSEAAELYGRVVMLLTRKQLSEVESLAPEQRPGLRAQVYMELTNCRDNLFAFMSGHSSGEALARLHVIVAELQWMRSNAEGILDELRQAAAISDLDFVGREQDALLMVVPGKQMGIDLSFLRGIALSETARLGQPDGAERLLEAEEALAAYLLDSKNAQGEFQADKRFFGSAWLGLATVQWKLDDPLQGLWCIAKAKKHLDTLLPFERDRLVLLETRANISLGRTKAALDSLTQEIKSRGVGFCPELELFAGETLLALSKPEAAIQVLASVIEQRDENGELARVLHMRALEKQKRYESLVLFALEWGELIHDPSLQAAVSGMLGDAYTALERYELAAEAYAGRIR